MKHKFLLCLFLLLSTFHWLVPLSAGLEYNSETYFQHKSILVEPDKYVLSWNYTAIDITFKVVVNGTKWVGFGLSPNGGMLNSDVIVAWLNEDGTSDFSDRSVTQTRYPIRDAKNNWKLLYISQANDRLTVIFTRKVEVCEKSDKSEINIDVQLMQYVIYAWGDRLVNNEILYHGGKNRGTKSLPLLGKLNKPVEFDAKKVETFDFRAQTVLKAKGTEYYCKMFKIPWSQEKRHLIRYETLESPESFKYLHHWLFYECGPQYETEYLAKRSEPQPNECFTIRNEWTIVNRYCSKISLVWGVGGDLIVDFPANLGYPIGGGKHSFRYFFLEMHYNNPDLVPNVKVNTGVRLYMTKEYRPIEFGVYSIGAFVNKTSIVLPPKVERISNDYYCRKKFVNQIFTDSNDNVTVFAVQSHTHLTGREVNVNVVRDNKAVSYVSRNEYYDFNFQYINFLPKPVILKRNDELLITCVFNTMDRTNFTVGGLITTDEMCLGFLWYYPRNENVGMCLEGTPFKTYENLFKRLNKTNDIQMNGSLDGLETGFESVLASGMSVQRRADLFATSFSNSSKFQLNYYKGIPYTYGFPAYNISRMDSKQECHERQSLEPIKSKPKSRYNFFNNLKDLIYRRIKKYKN